MCADRGWSSVHGARKVLGSGTWGRIRSPLCICCHSREVNSVTWFLLEDVQETRHRGRRTGEPDSKHLPVPAGGRYSGARSSHMPSLPLPAEAALTALRLGTGCGPSRDGDQSPRPGQPHPALPARGAPLHESFPLAAGAWDVAAWVIKTSAPQEARDFSPAFREPRATAQASAGKPISLRCFIPTLKF